ncbi:metal ABC transporter permease [Candidatus Acetothermia bacterium]|nr:metal ABC transporter permease [Candidatus Acetothermia bacterium]MCI2427268.1 metal ABC transporter permease [Candidatus Acetothermia bacterium]MCI2428354.1 metal ABC transporter permease [Candidatus Acetothermia bacterium]
MELEIFEFAFMQRAFLAGLVIAVVCPSIGLFLVLRRYALLAEGLGHIAFGGVSVGFLGGIDPVLGAFGMTGISAIAIEQLRRQGKLGGDTAIGVLIALGLAIGVVASSVAGAFNARLLGFLFGSIILVAPRDLYLITAIGTVVMLIVTLFGKELFYICFDEEAALAGGLPVKFFTMLLTIMTALTVVASLRIVGVLLVFALIILPVATAMQIAHSFRQARLLSVLFGLISVISGLFAAFYLDLPAGGAIVLIAGVLFVIVSGVATIIAKSAAEGS